MKVYTGYARLKIPETAADERRLNYAGALLIMNDGKAEMATCFEFRGGNGGSYGVEIDIEETPMPQ